MPKKKDPTLFNMKIKLPDKKKVRNFISIFKKSAKINAGKISRQIAEEIAAEAKQILEDQRYKWPPLSEGYEQFKQDHNLDPRILIATGYMKDHIEVWEEGGKVLVGFKPGAIHEPSGLELQYLARIHEFGTATIPPRQLWRPLLSKYLRQSKRFSKIYNRAVAKDMKKAKI